MRSEYFLTHNTACFYAHWNAYMIYRLTGFCVRFRVYKIDEAEWAIERIPEIN